MTAKFKDQILVAGSLAGDEEAFGQLYDKYADSIYRFILVRVSNQEEAQDLTSEVFLKSWQYLSSAEKTIENFKALIYRVARNLVIDFYRSKKNFALSLSDLEWGKLIDEESSLPDDVAKKDELAQIYKALEKIDSAQRDLLLMRYFDDLSVPEIAAVLGKSQGAVRVAMHRALRELKSVLREKKE